MVRKLQGKADTVNNHQSISHGTYIQSRYKQVNCKRFDCRAVTKTNQG